MTTTQVEYVAPPTRTSQGTILDIVTPHEGIPWGLTSLVDSFNCIGVDVDSVNCAGFKGLTKRFDKPAYNDGFLFNVQGGVTCKPFGFSQTDPRIGQAFAVQEAEGVSIGLHDTILVNGTDLTPAAGPVTPLQALGVLEGAGLSGYAGQPIIHVGPGLASQWAGAHAIVKTGNHLETLLGTPIAVSVGNETKTGGKLDANQWGFVTGAVALWRSEVVQESAVNQTTNDVTVLYERLYVAAVDCKNAKVSVKVL